MALNLAAKDIASVLEAWAPPSLAESYDNVGLLVGLRDMPVTGVTVSLDMTEEVLDDAVAHGCNMVVAHHPIWFGPRKRLNGEDYVSRVIMKAVKHDIALYACHTNLDAVASGVNAMIGRRLGVVDMQTLAGKKDAAVGMVLHVDPFVVDDLLITFATLGLADVQVGDRGRIDLLCASHMRAIVMREVRKMDPNAAIQSHPALETLTNAGSGMIGRLPNAMPKAEFLAHVKAAFGCGGIRYADCQKDSIQKVAWCGGAGSFLTQAAMQAGADALVTGDITYHKFFDGENQMMLLDIGHYESEQFTSELIAHYLSEKFPTFAVRLSKVITNPVKYY